MQQSILKLKLNDPPIRIKLIQKEPFWKGENKFGWNVMVDGKMKTLFATKNLNDDILDKVEKGIMDCKIEYNDYFKGYNTYYIYPEWLTINK